MPMHKSEKELGYSQKFAAMDREALATVILAVALTVFFWGAVFLLKDRPEFVASMPLWFVVSCIGGYLLSVAGVMVLVRFFMTDFSLGEEKGGDQAEDGNGRD
ncbi:MAG: YhdT family protein [Succinivibrio sp.]